MNRLRRQLCIKCFWFTGLLSFLWLLLRSGTNPKRLTYPCQQAAMPLALNWLAATIAFITTGLIFRRFLQFSSASIVIIGVVWFLGSTSEISESQVKEVIELPTWESSNPVSTVFVIDSIPPTSGSLAAGDASVPDAYLSDPAIDTIFNMMARNGIYFHRTSLHPEGIISPNDVVIIKANFQWTSRNGTSTDRVKGVINQILQHPDGFSGEIIVCDNTQDFGTGINENDNNSEDTYQSIIDVINTFSAKGYKVSVIDWNYIWSVSAVEYSEGNYNDGYVYEASSKISYPKFRTPLGNHYLSLRHGIWDSAQAVYDRSRLRIISMPVLKAHGMAGSTIAVKNWVGIMTTAESAVRFGGSNSMHYTYMFGPYALVARVMDATFPDLSIVDAAWITTDGPANTWWVTQTDLLAASTDPVAVSWYTARYMLTPVARYPQYTDPELEGSLYNNVLRNWTTFLHDSAGHACTMDSADISVFDRGILVDSFLCGDSNSDGTVNLGDAGYLINYIFFDGAAPDPIEYSDSNGDGSINLGDAGYIINYIFYDGTAPICP